jgi:hypothetical protein
MHHIREIDPQHTVIMVQVENETGSYGSPRDFSAVAQRLFEQPIPAALARRIGKNGTWSQAFGWKSDQAFNAWYTARYVDEVAAAGQAELNLPMYVNAALGDAFKEESAPSGASGGPQLECDRHLESGRAAHRDRGAGHLRSRCPRLRAICRALRPARQSAVHSRDQQRGRLCPISVARHG